MVELPTALVDALRGARSVAVLTGAGVSAESGIPTFRDAQTGLWAQYRPEELATPEAFRARPRLVWEWYAWRRELCAKSAPNPGHLALAELAGRIPDFTLITQNVDGLHARGGSRDVIELHGNIYRARCFEGGHVFESWEESGEPPPRCPRCQSLLRPDVVWFGEQLPRAALARAEEAAERCELFFTIGTSALVQPAASLPLVALRRGALVAEVNPQPTPLSDAVTYAIPAPAGELLPALLRAAWP
jgi:NAD-dependent deacetylase